MAATEACTAPVQEDSATETKSEVETNSETVNNEVVNKETVNNEVVNNEAASTETGASNVVEEAKPAGGEETPAASTEQPAESKAKPASDGIWDSFLNKSGLGKVMGGRKKREQSTGAEEANAEGAEEKVNGEEVAAEGGEAAAAPADDQAIEKAAEGEEGEAKKEGKDAKTKQGEKSSVRDMIRNPVARIFSHKSTEKKDEAGGEPQKQVRSKSLDRLEDPEACNAEADPAEPTEEPQAAEEEAQKPSTSTSTKHMKRWHSFKKLMAQRTHKKSADDPKDTEVVEGVAEAGAGDSSTLDSKGENSGQKRWKLKRSWTFQGLKRDPSIGALSKAAKGSDKDGAESKGEETTETEGEQTAAGESEEAKAAEEGAALEKADGEEGKGAAAAGASGTVSQHANEIWTSFKKRVTPKSKKPAAEGAAGGEEDAAAAAPAVPAASGDQEPAEEQGAGKEAKSAKAKRTHFNRAVSLKNFILRKGKSSSVDQPDGQTKEGEEEEAAATGGDGEAEAPAGEADSAHGESGDKAEAQVANDHTAEGSEENQPDAAAAAKAAPTPENGAAAAEPAPAAAPTPAAPEVTTNGENGCTNGTTEDDATHNHECSPKKDEVNSTNAAKDAKMAKASQGNAVAQSEKKAGNV